MMNDSHALTSKARGVVAWIKRRLVLGFDAAFVAGRLQKDYFASLGMEPSRIVLGYDAVDNRYFAEAAISARASAENVRRRLGLPGRYFLCVGRMVPKKNFGLVVQAYAILRERLGRSDLRLVFVGSGELERALQDQCIGAGLSVYRSANRDGVDGSVDADAYFLGFRQAPEIAEIMALATAFVLPSSEEEWGLVVNEAMACGLPVVVSKLAGCAPELVLNGVNGFQFDPYDPVELAQRLEAIAASDALGRQMAHASKEIIEDWGCDRFARGAAEAARLASCD